MKGNSDLAISLIEGAEVAVDEIKRGASGSRLIRNVYVLIDVFDLTIALILMEHGIRKTPFTTRTFFNRR